MQFIFTVSNEDIAFCPTEYLKQIVQRIKESPEKTFLIQSKDPATFSRVTFPPNVILRTTIETNRDRLYEGISKAPLPSSRYRDFLRIEHPLKMVTIDPILDLDVDVMRKWMLEINPCMIWIGYDSKNNYLPKPTLEKTRRLYWKLGREGFTVILKTIRSSWWERTTVVSYPKH